VPTNHLMRIIRELAAVQHHPSLCPCLSPTESALAGKPQHLKSSLWVLSQV
jgi:hypothetical protein